MWLQGPSRLLSRSAVLEAPLVEVNTCPGRCIVISNGPDACCRPANPAQSSTPPALQPSSLPLCPSALLALLALLVLLLRQRLAGACETHTSPLVLSDLRTSLACWCGLPWPACPPAVLAGPEGHRSRASTLPKAPTVLYHVCPDTCGSRAPEIHFQALISNPAAKLHLQLRIALCLVQAWRKLLFLLPTVLISPIRFGIIHAWPVAGGVSYDPSAQNSWHP